jgi:glycosyltransferase involved in cell wall biosynthesis
MPKMIRLDMAVDTGHFPCIKKNFNVSGKRGFLFIGRNDAMKGTDFLSGLARALPEFRFGWIGWGDEIEGVPRISPARALTPDFMAEVAQDYDFFISPSQADPNPTTILESMAWGFPVVCTPQSGYYETSYRKNIFYGDLDRSVDVLRDMQFADEEVLRSAGAEARRVVKQEYSWDVFVQRICTGLRLGEPISGKC